LSVCRLRCPDHKGEDDDQNSDDDQDTPYSRPPLSVTCHTWTPVITSS